MSRSGTERRLRQVSQRLKELTEEVRVGEEQLQHLGEEADDARIRAVVAETAGADRERRDAQRHADAMHRHLAAVRAEIGDLERAQDELLDRYSAD